MNAADKDKEGDNRRTFKMINVRMKKAGENMSRELWNFNRNTDLRAMSGTKSEGTAKGNKLRCSNIQTKRELKGSTKKQWNTKTKNTEESCN
jgi:hypothetical protein